MLSAAWLMLSSLLYSLQLSTGSFPAPLTEEEERHYLALSAQGDLEARNILIERNLRLVAHIMKKYYAQSADQEDLISIGTIGLIKGISTFDPSKGARLATYAARCVENAILSQMRDFAAVWTCQAGNNVLKYFLELVSMRISPSKGDYSHEHSANRTGSPRTNTAAGPGNRPAGVKKVLAASPDAGCPAVAAGTADSVAADAGCP